MTLIVSEVYFVLWCLWEESSQLGCMVCRTCTDDLVLLMEFLIVEEVTGRGKKD